MASVKIRIDTRRLRERLQEMIEAYDDLTPAMEEASEYMVRSTKNRIYQGRKDPITGEPWAPLAEATVKRKGHARPLVETGSLAESIQAIHVNQNGFTIRSRATDERGRSYASYMQSGFRHARGGKRVPARPFIGFSETNNKRIAKILSDHLRYSSIEY